MEKSRLSFLRPFEILEGLSCEPRWTLNPNTWGNFTLCQTSKTWDNVVSAHYCNLPKYNASIGGALGTS
jgi:hypothetical protein